MVGMCLVGIFKVGTVSYIMRKVFSVLDKKDYAGMMNLCGLVGISEEVVKLVHYWSENPPAIVTFFGDLIENIGDLTEGIGTLIDKINKVFGV